MDFVAIDFETAVSHHICAVGIVIVRNGEIVETFYSLIQPPRNLYNWHNTQVHGITERHTLNAPRFREVYPEIAKRIKNQRLVAHNESFDRNVLVKSMQDSRLNYLDLELAEKWDCTMKIYKSKGYKPAKLDACCSIHNIELQHHDALSDARACAQLFILAQQNN